MCYPNSTYQYICQSIPEGYESIDKVKMYVFLQLTSYFLNYTANINTTNSSFSGPNILKNREFQKISN
jgi:hypothetical protein